MTSYQSGKFSSICLLHGCVIIKVTKNYVFCWWFRRKLDYSITTPCRYQFEAAVFNQERLLYWSLYCLIVNLKIPIQKFFLFAKFFWQIFSCQIGQYRERSKNPLWASISKEDYQKVLVFKQTITSFFCYLGQSQAWWLQCHFRLVQL